jgi:L-alanine-DL-glutamate epimerase-like enolase superfamily enzyme
MKITDIQVCPVQAPGRTLVPIVVETDEGLTGVGEAGLQRRWKAIIGAVEHMKKWLIGKDPMRIEHLWQEMFRGGFYPADRVIGSAISGLDIALWDIKGKALGLPVCTLLGGHRDRVPTYASGALMRPMPTDYLKEAGPRLVGMGFKQMKTQLGAEPTVAKEIERIRVLREGIGEDIDLMCDINQLWNVNQAIDIGRRIEEYHLFWLEDVVAHDDYQGLARVADALTTPICAGEYHYGIRPFRHMLEARSIDIVMIDLLRAGGITQWMKIAGMAQAFNVPVVSHLIPEVHVHLIAAIPHGLTVEYMPWTLRLFEETPALEDGQIVVPQKPGLGLKFDEGALRHFDIS